MAAVRLDYALGDRQAETRSGDRMPAFALLDNIRSAWNVGAMFRTADAVALYRELEPRFDEDAIERVRAQVISGLRSNARDPGGRYRRCWRPHSECRAIPLRPNGRFATARYTPLAGR